MSQKDLFYSGTLNFVDYRWLEHKWVTKLQEPFLHKWKTSAIFAYQFSLVQFSGSVVSNSLRPHESQHTRAPCLLPTPGVHSNSCPSSQWCHPAILFSVVPFSSCPQSLPASVSFPMSQLFASGGQSIGVSASTSWESSRESWSFDPAS